MEYFGQYGNLIKIVVNTKKVHIPNNQKASYGAYITYSQDHEASLAILAVEQFELNSRMMRASFGTTKYCSFFLQNLKCQNRECLYLHQFHDTNETYLKDEMSNKKVFQEQQRIAIETSGIRSLPFESFMMQYDSYMDDTYVPVLPTIEEVYHDYNTNEKRKRGARYGQYKRKQSNVSKNMSSSLQNQPQQNTQSLSVQPQPSIPTVSFHDYGDTLPTYMYPPTQSVEYCGSQEGEIVPEPDVMQQQDTCYSSAVKVHDAIINETERKIQSMPTNEFSQGEKTPLTEDQAYKISPYNFRRNQVSRFNFARSVDPKDDGDQFKQLDKICEIEVIPAHILDLIESKIRTLSNSVRDKSDIDINQIWSLDPTLVNQRLKQEASSLERSMERDVEEKQYDFNKSEIDDETNTTSNPFSNYQNPLPSANVDKPTLEDSFNITIQNPSQVKQDSTVAEPQQERDPTPSFQQRNDKARGRTEFTHKNYS